MIVVIGILATIVIVAYNGIQQRTRNLQTVSAAHDYLAAFQGYVAQNSSYPPVATGGYWCLGQEAISCTAAIGTWSRSAALETALQTVITRLPLPSNGPGTNITPDPNMGYISASAPANYPMLDGVNSGFLIYILEGDTPCPVGPVASGIWPNFFKTAPVNGRTFYVDGISECWVPLPAN